MGITIRSTTAVLLLIFGFTLVMYYYFFKNNMSSIIPILGFFTIAFGAKIMKELYMQQS